MGEEIMKFKKIMFVSILLLAILTIGAVSASDENVTDELTVIENLDVESPVENSVLDDSLENQVDEKLNVGDGYELKQLIRTAESGSEIKLEQDYEYNLDGSISIDNPLTIDGQNHRISDVNGNNEILYLDSEYVVFKNIEFYNTRIHAEGPDNSNNTVCSFINCTFINCSSKSVDYGGAISLGPKSNVVNCTFINCFARNEKGGAIFVSTECRVDNCSFIGCYVPGGNVGGAIALDGRSNLVSNCRFINCSAYEGGAIYIYVGIYNRVVGCSIINCSAGYGGAIGIYSNNNTLDNCCFVNCSASVGGGSLSFHGDHNKILNSAFLNSYSPRGGAIILDKKYWDKDKMYHCIVDNSNFTHSSDNNGRVIYSKYNVTVTNCKFENNNVSSLNDTAYNGVFANCTFYESGSSEGNGDNGTGGNAVPAKLVANNLNMIYSSGSAFKVTVYGTNGKLASGESVVIKVDGKAVSTAKTNSNGVATYKPTQKPGSYKISATALGKTVTKTITIKHLVTLKAATVKKSAKKLVLQATLGKVNGKYLKSKKVTFKFNGKKYTAKTNNKGVAKVTIKSSVLKKLKVGKKITYQATYSKDTVKKTAKVKK